MPRISFSRGGASEQSSMEDLFPLYSLSGTLVLLIQLKLTKKNIQHLNSEVIFAVPRKYIKRNSLVPGDKVIVKSGSISTGNARYSLQYRWNCPDTNTVVAFQESPWETDDENKTPDEDSDSCLYVYSSMIFKSSVEALKEVTQHVEIEKIPQSIRVREGVVRVALQVKYKSKIDEIVGLTDEGLVVSITETEKNEKAANHLLLGLIGLVLDSDPGSLSLDWDTVLGCLVVLVPNKKQTEVYNALKECLSSK
mmetsp:Transcript_5608/g.7104  ORF Transcript_5608/g.7104 Transcript_5608/m.7104 type:complete len:252 (-) Transcript_5608:1442-2197(-)|eukprot:CAMPEP_0204822278 /NCGR_PEP_ID=MMETSP1346-20131115/456_1 /ASSEMBLY_ACC=CAM_ASM_000771 /TAXON_ID=215587 /ORGANISM="Aplanochytrium stocchinoi, Strain GSBS06" /LENGTH=251 /DNA_ID=CAMNT_0051948391 /DNA_START=113 /DNA_END=868 /DNA_ORIENTATION=-